MYQGSFENDEMSGLSTYMYKDGSKYVGEFRKNLKEGNGILTIKFRDGVEIYDGFFKEGLMDGFGALTLKDLNVYKGDFSQDFAHGNVNIIHYDLGENSLFKRRLPGV